MLHVIFLFSFFLSFFSFAQVVGDRLIFADSSAFEGEIKDDGTIGKGRYSFPDGSSYRGSFINNKFNGLGKYRWNVSEGHFYTGHFVEGKRHGYGEFFFLHKFNNKTYLFIYKGEWKNDKMNDRMGKLITVMATTMTLANIESTIENGLEDIEQWEIGVDAIVISSIGPFVNGLREGLVLTTTCAPSPPSPPPPPTTTTTTTTNAPSPTAFRNNTMVGKWEKDEMIDILYQNFYDYNHTNNIDNDIRIKEMLDIHSINIYGRHYYLVSLLKEIQADLLIFKDQTNNLTDLNEKRELTVQTLRLGSIDCGWYFVDDFHLYNSIVISVGTGLDTFMIF